MKKIIALGISLVILALASCVDSAQDTRNYIIVNETDENVTLRFFRFESGNFTLSFTAEKEGRGIVLERFISVNQRDNSSAAAAFEADSVALIFNNERVRFYRHKPCRNNSFGF